MKFTNDFSLKGNPNLEMRAKAVTENQWATIMTGQIRDFG